LVAIVISLTWTFWPEGWVRNALDINEDKDDLVVVLTSEKALKRRNRQRARQHARRRRTRRGTYEREKTRSQNSHSVSACRGVSSESEWYVIYNGMRLNTQRERRNGPHRGGHAYRSEQDRRRGPTSRGVRGVRGDGGGDGGRKRRRPVSKYRAHVERAVGS